MTTKIVADSCCDLTPAMREAWGVTTVPLTLTLGDRSYIDDDALDLPAFMADMARCTGRIGSAAPAPDLYLNAYKGADEVYAVTLSGNLSGSRASAAVAADIAAEDGMSVTVFDSKSASAGEILLVSKLRQWLDEGLPKPAILERAEHCVREMKTFFVLDNLDNMRKNGRLNLITGMILNVLHIKPLLGSDGDGNIALFSRARGAAQIIERLGDLVAKSGRHTEGEPLVVTHCGNPDLAARLADSLRARFGFGETLVLPTRGLSSVYASDKGVIFAY